ncbi:MAG: helix-turn-helix domain-containing protein [Bacteroidales bacterium]|nr:helix-turn-helix domain-containing protein [Bacteroidales bacterium]
MEIHSLKSNEFNLSVNEIDYQPTYDYSKIHRHTYFEIFLFEKAKGGKQIIDFNTYEIKDKTLYIVAPNQVHLLKRLKNENGIILQFTSEYLKTSIPSTPANLLFALKANPKTKLTLIDYNTLLYSFQYLKKLYKSNEVYKNEKIAYFFSFTIFQILGVLQNKSNDLKKDNLTFQFLLSAENHFVKNRNISEYARMLNISVTKLNKQIKKDLGKTPLQIIHELLIVEIKRLIIIEQLSHKEISNHLQFDSQSSYNRFVNKQLGCNPTELSKSLEIHK